MKKMLGFLSLLICCTTVFATPIKYMTFFGDSLTDNGNLYSYLSQQLPKDPPYFKGRFSNGITWAEIVGKHYQDNDNVITANYAVGGATAILRDPVKGGSPFEMIDEINLYLSNTTLDEHMNTLYFIWIGANDYFAEDEQNPDALTTDVVQRITDDVQELINNGGQHFVIIDLPNLSKTPRGLAANEELAKRWKRLSFMHHQKLLNATNTFKSQYPDFSFTFIDSLSALANPKKYNKKYSKHITNTTDSCWLGDYMLRKSRSSQYSDIKTFDSELANAYSKNITLLKKTPNALELSKFIMNSPTLNEAYRVQKLKESGMTPCENPDNYVFWDTIHPTRAMHEIFANVVIEALANDGINNFVVDNRVAH
ncbi:MAG: SGNH/GDSL hydrolase family protein [Gammaproteobacteria bacterium]